MRVLLRAAVSSQDEPLVIVVVVMIDTAAGAHDDGHLLKEDAVVALDGGKLLLLELELLELEVKVHVGGRSRVIDGSADVADLIERAVHDE